MMSFSTLAFRVKLVIQELIKALIIYPSVITGLFFGAFYLYSDLLVYEYYVERSETSQMTARPGHLMTKDCVSDSPAEEDFDKDFARGNKILVEPVKCLPVFREVSIEVATNEAVSGLGQMYYSFLIIGIFCYLMSLVVRIKEHKGRKKAMKHHQASINTI